MTGPVEAVLSALAALGGLSDPLAWLVVVAFVGGSLLELRAREHARYVLAGAWLLFGLFWLTLVHHFAVEQKSLIEGVGSLAAVPLSVYVGALLYRGRDSLFVLSRAVAGMGAVFMPFEALAVLRRPLIETVTRQTEVLMTVLGYDPAVLTWSEATQRIAARYDWSTARTRAFRDAQAYADYRNTFFFLYGGDYPITYTIRLACTGLGSMAIFAGLIAAVRAPFRRKARALAVSVPVIYALNLVRNVFIGLAFGQQRMQLFVPRVMDLFGTTDSRMVSYYLADRVIAQSLSVVALVAITWLVVRELPEVLAVVEDVLYVLTGNEYDLGAALDVGAEEPAPDSDPATVRADGGE
ncbi:MAG: archaeosortase A [Haloglomus sp.]